MIAFHRPGDLHGYLSNFFTRFVELRGRRWKTSEHFFQAQKFAGTEYEELVARAETPREAARIGRDRMLPLRADWEEVKDGIMREVVRAKFVQHEDLRTQLLATDDEELVELTPTDRYWGRDGRGEGRNMLGVILMEVRASLRGQVS